MTLTFSLDFGMYEWNWFTADFLWILWDGSRFHQEPQQGNELWLCRDYCGNSLTARVKTGEQDLGSKGEKGNLHWFTHKTVPPKNVKIRSGRTQISKIWQYRLFWGYLKTSSTQSEVYFCSALGSCYLCWWDCVSKTSHILKKGFLS